MRRLAVIPAQSSDFVKRISPILLLLFLLAASVTLATALQLRAPGWSKRAASGSLFKLLLGDGRRMFANHFFVKADVSFHSGYYPSIFDRAAAPKDSRHMTEEEEHEGHEQAGTESHKEEHHEAEMDFLGPPRDIFEKFGRHFMVTEHKHLGAGNEREILPWLKLSAELDPQRVDTYIVAAYWLRQRLGKNKEAEEFLRDGVKNNPDSYELLTELGTLYYDNLHDAVRARNVWEAALKRWNQRESKSQKPDYVGLDQILVRLGHLEEDQRNYERAIYWLELAKRVSPNPAGIEAQIKELQQKAASK